MGSELTVSQRKKLEGHEETIEQGLKSFVEVGIALMAIRDDKLYEAADETFEAYCERRWNFTRGRAYQLIDAAKVVEAVSTIVDIAPANEAQARVLTKLPTEKLQQKVWEKAVETAPQNEAGEPVVTAAHVQAVADKIAPLKVKKPKKPPKPAADDGPQPKNGKQKNDPRPFDGWESLYGQITRKTDDLHRAKPADKFKREVQAALNEAFKSFKNWKALR